MSARTAVIGFDACDPAIAATLMDAGRMPHLASLVRRGLRRSLVPPYGLYVGSIWPSLATGTGPAVHGIYSWRQFVPGAYATKRMQPAEAGGVPMWDSLSRAGAKVAIVDAPLSAPSQELNGLQIVDWGSHDRWMATNSVGADDLLHDRPSHPIEVRCDHTARTRPPASMVEALLEGATAKGDLSLDVLHRDSWDLFLTVFSESHCAGHHLWKHHDVNHVAHDPEAAIALGGDPLLDVYEALDVQLGRLLEDLDDATVMVILSHGFVPHYGGEHILAEALLRIENAIAPTPTTRAISGSAHRAGHWATKKVRARFAGGDPSLASLDGARAFFQVPNNERFGGIRLNVAGREPQGFIDPSAPSGIELIDRLKAELLALRCPTSGRQVVSEVIRVDDHHRGPRRAHLPDLLVDWEWSAPIDAAVSPTVGLVAGRYSGIRSGDHRPAGEVIVVHPGMADTENDGGGSIRIEDLAPTIAASLGESLTDVDGVVVPELAGSSV